jgi:hypothetical protein
MHREILGLNHGDRSLVDHRNGNTLDNRRCNLRLATRAQNVFNTAKRKAKATSKYKGVTWSKQASSNGTKYDGKWRAQIRHNSKLIHIGMFTNELEAARAYNSKAKELFGEFARLNDVA